MASKKESGCQERMDFDTARALAMDVFVELHPKDTWPIWLADHATIGGTRDNRNRWMMSLTVAPPVALNPNEYWEEVDGERVLVSIDPLNGRKWYVIDRAPREVITLFEVVIDPMTGEIAVQVDSNLAEVSF